MGWICLLFAVAGACLAAFILLSVLSFIFLIYGVSKLIVNGFQLIRHRIKKER